MGYWRYAMRRDRWAAANAARSNAASDRRASGKAARVARVVSAVRKSTKENPVSGEFDLAKLIEYSNGAGRINPISSYLPNPK